MSFAPDYFDPAYFETPVAAPAVVLAGGAVSPYFECAYFDQTYFDTDCTPTPTTTGGRGGRLRVVTIERPFIEDPDELLALI